MARPLAGKRALVTGGAKRIGRALALTLAEAGADVAITFRGSVADAEATVADLRGLGAKAVALRCDVGDEASVQSAVGAVVAEFGGLDGLVEAILAKRMPEVNALQAELLAGLEANGACTDVRALLDAFLRPLLEQVNSDGERAYARFISALLRSAEGEHYCGKLFHLTPTTGRVLALLHEAIPAVPLAIMHERLRLLTGLVCTSVFNRNAAVSDAHADDRLIGDALDVAAAGLVAPAAWRAPAG